MKFFFVAFAFTLITWVCSYFFHKKQLDSAINSTNKIKNCGYLLGIESTKVRFSQEYFVIQNNQKEIDKFNFDPEFDVHQNIKYSGEIRQGEKICYEYTYIHTYMDTIKILSVHDKFHRTLILSGFCLLKIAKISLSSSFFPKPIKR